MARSTGCCGRCCGCCLWVAVSLPPSFYALLFALLSAGAIGAGAYFIVFAIQFGTSNAGAFISKEVYVGSLALGVAMALLGGYGLIGAGLGGCKGSKDVHLKIHYVLSLLVFLALISFMAVCLLNANDKENIDAMLDYGWQKAFSIQSKNQLILRAQVDGNCCGFTSPKDRSLPTCPSSPTGGCQPKLRDALSTAFAFAGLLFGASAGGVFLTMGVAHGWIERIIADRMKTASGAGDDEARWALLDAARTAKGGRMNAFGIPGRAAPGALPAANIGSGFGDAAFYNDPDPGDGLEEGRRGKKGK